MFLPKFIRKIQKKIAITRFYSNFIGKDDLCFDIGANLGERTECFLKLKAKVLTIEPQAKCFQFLSKRYGDNPQVKVLKYALGRTPTTAKLKICAESDECSTLSKDFIAAFGEKSGLHWPNEEIVSVTTLDMLIAEFGVPHFCKIDVEGYESEVIHGLTYPIKYLNFEFNQALLADTALSLERLASLGDYECNYIKYEHMHLVLPNWLPIAEFRAKLTHFITPDLLTGEIMARLRK